MKRASMLGLFLIVALANASCVNRPLNALVPCTITAVTNTIPVTPTDKVDLLFVIDTSLSMRFEQQELAANLSVLIETLQMGGANNPSIDNFPPVSSLHVGFVTTDLGADPTEGNPPGTCSPNGDGAALQTVGSIGAAPTMGGEPQRMSCKPWQFQAFQTPYLDFPALYSRPDTVPPMPIADQFRDDFECAVGQMPLECNGDGCTGTLLGGCGFERQIEATIRGIERAALDGVIRDDAVLGVILVTDEDDCTADDQNLYVATDITPENPYQGPSTTGGTLQPGLRCGSEAVGGHPGALTNVNSLVSQMATLRSTLDTREIVFAAITGIPTSLDPEATPMGQDPFQHVLDAPAMQEMIAAAGADTQTAELEPVCVKTGDDDAKGAKPARRIVELAQQLRLSGFPVVLQSICADDYSAVLVNIVERIGESLKPPCLPRPLDRSQTTGLVDCEVVEVLPAGEECSLALGRTLDQLRTDARGDGRQVCVVEQLSSAGDVIPTGTGWYYDDFSPNVSECEGEEVQRVTFTASAPPMEGSTIRLECLEPVEPQDIDIGTSCGGDDANCARTAESLEAQYNIVNGQLFCEPTSNSCQIQCTTNADCPGGFSCLTDSAAPYCVNATCTTN